MVVDHYDGTLTITQTRDCALFAIYANRLAPSLEDIQTYTAFGFIVSVTKGNSAVPETLAVFDPVSGETFDLVIPEESTGEICIAYPALA